MYVTKAVIFRIQQLLVFSVFSYVNFLFLNYVGFIRGSSNVWHPLSSWKIFARSYYGVVKIRERIIVLHTGDLGCRHPVPVWRKQGRSRNKRNYWLPGHTCVCFNSIVLLSIKRWSVVTMPWSVLLE